MISLNDSGLKPKLSKRRLNPCLLHAEHHPVCALYKGCKSCVTATTNFSIEAWIQVSSTQFNFPIWNLSEPQHFERECFLSCIESNQEIMDCFAILNVENGTQDLTHANDHSATTLASRVFFTVKTSYFISICVSYIIMDFILIFSCLHLMSIILSLSVHYPISSISLPFHFSTSSSFTFKSLGVCLFGSACVCMCV